MPLDFTSAARLFMGTEDELARALDVELGDLRAIRTNPGQASPELLRRMAQVLAERGRGMIRVSEMLEEDAAG
jgi:hypothetical protein